MHPVRSSWSMPVSSYEPSFHNCNNKKALVVHPYLRIVGGGGSPVPEDVSQQLHLCVVWRDDADVFVAHACRAELVDVGADQLSLCSVAARTRQRLLHTKRHRRGGDPMSKKINRSHTHTHRQNPMSEYTRYGICCYKLLREHESDSEAYTQRYRRGGVTRRFDMCYIELVDVGADQLGLCSVAARTRQRLRGLRVHTESDRNETPRL